MKPKNSSQIAGSILTATYRQVFVLSLIVVLLINLKPVNAQSKSPESTISERTKLKRIALGLRVSNLYDIKYTAYDNIPGGFAANDPYGLHGAKTKFDMAAGMDFSYFYSPLISVDFSYDQGKMTGANLTEYYKSNVSIMGLGANIAMRLKQDKKRILVPYIRASISQGEYDAQRMFIKDDVTFSRTKGKAILIGFGAGLRYHINKYVHLNLMSEYVTIYTDAWDGYDYGSGKDQLLKTSLGIRISIGRGNHADQ